MNMPDKDDPIVFDAADWSMPDTEQALARADRDTDKQEYYMGMPIDSRAYRGKALERPYHVLNVDPAAIPDILAKKQALIDDISEQLGISPEMLNSDEPNSYAVEAIERHRGVYAAIEKWREDMRAMMPVFYPHVFSATDYLIEPVGNPKHNKFHIIPIARDTPYHLSRQHKILVRGRRTIKRVGNKMIQPGYVYVCIDHLIKPNPIVDQVNLKVVITKTGVEFSDMAETVNTEHVGD